MWKKIKDYWDNHLNSGGYYPSSSNDPAISLGDSKTDDVLAKVLAGWLILLSPIVAVTLVGRFLVWGIFLLPYILLTKLWHRIKPPYTSET